jgi:flavin-dependent thymidylate synthase
MPLTVVLAGHNVDRQALEARLLGKSAQEAGTLSPETLSAAYARISRDPRPVTQLRQDARQEVDRARRSNQSIIFEMGHSSVAEHAVFNFDVLGLSRLAVEALEHHRLASYTEKSQRYIRLEGEYVTPDEIMGSPLQERFQKLVLKLARFYQELADRLLTQARMETKEKIRQRDLESKANEDARYILPLCAAAQLGMTVNARSLELMIARLNSHPLVEMQTLGTLLYQAVVDTAPSVVRYVKPTAYFRDTAPALAHKATEILGKNPTESHEAVRLISHTPAPDQVIAAGLLFSQGTHSQDFCLQRARTLDPAQLQSLFAEVFGRMELFDSLPRAFELVDFTFELALSSAAFAQLKRHRMATILAQAYDPGLGLTIPDSVARAGQAEAFKEHAEEACELSRSIQEQSPQVAAYALTNAHRRRVLIKFNGRALGHFSRLRCDHEAQWDIRQIAESVVLLVRQVMPLAGSFLGGKDCFPSLKDKFAADH